MLREVTLDSNSSSAQGVDGSLSEEIPSSWSTTRLCRFYGQGTKRKRKKRQPRTRGRENADTRAHAHTLTRRPSGGTPSAQKLEVGVTPEAFPLTAGGGSDESVKLSNFPLF